MTDYHSYWSCVHSMLTHWTWAHLRTKIWRDTVLCCAVLCCAMLCCAVLCCARRELRDRCAMLCVVLCWLGSMQRTQQATNTASVSVCCGCVQTGEHLFAARLCTRLYAHLVFEVPLGLLDRGPRGHLQLTTNPEVNGAIALESGPHLQVHICCAIAATRLKHKPRGHHV